MCHSLQYLGRLTVYSNVFSRREQLVLARRVHNTYTPLPSNTLRAVRIMGNYNIFFLLAVSTFNVISCDEAVCTPGTVTEGESVNVTCHFGEGADLKIITVHKMANENDMSGSLLECYQKSDIHICYPAPDYKCECRFHGTLFIVTMSDNEPAEYNQCDCTFSDKLTLAIPEVTQKHAGKYVCQNTESDPEVCYLVVKVEENLSSGGINTDVTNAGVIVAAVLVPVILVPTIIAIVVLILHRKRIICRSAQQKPPGKHSDEANSTCLPGDNAQGKCGI